MRAPICVDDRCFRVAAHPARAHEVSGPVHVPDVLAAGGPKNLPHRSGRVVDEPLIVLVMTEEHLGHRQPIAIPLVIVQLDPVAELRKGFADDAEARLVIIVEHRAAERGTPKVPCGAEPRPIPNRLLHNAGQNIGWITPSESLAPQQD